MSIFGFELEKPTARNRNKLTLWRNIMKQKHAEFGSSCLRKTTKRASQYKLIAACILLAMSLSTASQAESVFVTVGTDSLHFSTLFPVWDWGNCVEPLQGYIRSWSPSSYCEPQPTDTVEYAKAKNWAHFQILSEDGSCMIFNGRLDRDTSVPYLSISRPLEMSLPTNQTLNSSSFTFGESSYFISIAPYPVPGSDLIVESCKSYIFQITEQTDRCPPDFDGEYTIIDQLVEIPCETNDCCDLAGDANHDGTFSVLDLTYLIDYFIRESVPPPDCLGEGDANGDCSFDEDGDLNYMIAYIFTGGPAPVCPCAL